MRSYEGVFIFPPESAPEARKKQFKSIDDLIQKLQGIIAEKNDWGKKPLGYPVRKFKEGYFLIVHFQMDPAKLEEFRKTLELQEELLKFMLTLKTQKLTKPSAEKSHPQAVKSVHSVEVPSTLKS